MTTKAPERKEPKRARSIADKTLDAAENAALKSKWSYEEVELSPGVYLGVGVKLTYSLKSDGVHGAMFLRNLSDSDAAELINAREIGSLDATIARMLVEVPLREHEAQG